MIVRTSPFRTLGFQLFKPSKQVSLIDQTVYVYFVETDQALDFILTRLNSTAGSYSSIEIDGHILIHKFIYYTYAILPLCFYQWLRMQPKYSIDQMTHFHFGISTFGTSKVSNRRRSIFLQSDHLLW
jgi:hypothetical protein